jgi:ribosomal protein S8
MPTEKQQWLDKYNTYHAATEYNRQHYGKRIKQLKKMLEDEKFLEYLSAKECKEDILHYLAKSNEFDMYIAYTEQGEPYIHDHDFGLINHIKKMLRVLQSENFIKNSQVRPQAKRYVQMYVWYDKEPQDDLPDLPF